MLPDLLLAVIAATPLIVLLLLRSNAAIVFLAVCAGIVLQEFFGPDAHMILEAALPRSSSVYGQVLDITLVSLPPLAACIMLRKKSKGFKYLLGIIPGLCAGLLLALAITEYISPLTREQVKDTIFWKNLFEFRGLVAALGVVSSLALLKPSKKHEDGKKKHK